MLVAAAGLLGILRLTTGVELSLLPMLLFGVVFGLSMDYEVFLLSRVKEEYDSTGDNTLRATVLSRWTCRAL